MDVTVADLLLPLAARGAYLAERIDEAMESEDSPGAARWLVEAGDALATLGRAEPVIPLYEAAAGLARDSGERLYEAGIQWRLGQLYEALNRFDDAIAAYDRSGSGFGASADQMLALQASGRCRLKTRGAEDAIRLFRESLTWARDSGEPALVAGAMLALAQASAELGSFGEATASFREAVRLFGAIPGDDARRGEVVAAVGLSECLLDDGRHVDAVTALAPVEPFLEGMSDLSLRGRALGLMARFFLEAGQDEDASGRFEEALELLVKAGPEANRSRGLLMLAFARKLEGRQGPEAVVTLYQSAVTLLHATGEKQRLAPAAYSCARAFLANNELVRADAVIDLALQTCHEIADLQGLELCSGLGVRIAMRMGQAALALERMTLLADLKAELGDVPGEVRALLEALRAAEAVPDLDGAGIADRLMEALRRSGGQSLGPGEAASVAETLEGVGRPDHGQEILVMQAWAHEAADRHHDAAAHFASGAALAYRASDLTSAEALWDQAIALGERYGLSEVEDWRLTRDRVLSY